jgi:hypothetical protein
MCLQVSQLRGVGDTCMQKPALSRPMSFRQVLVSLPNSFSCTQKEPVNVSISLIIEVHCYTRNQIISQSVLLGGL